MQSSPPEERLGSKRLQLSGRTINSPFPNQAKSQLKEGWAFPPSTEPKSHAMSHDFETGPEPSTRIPTKDRKHNSWPSLKSGRHYQRVHRGGWLPVSRRGAFAIAAVTIKFCGREHANTRAEGSHLVLFTTKSGKGLTYSWDGSRASQSRKHR